MIQRAVASQLIKGDIHISSASVSPRMLLNPVHLLALGLGSGLSPKAPGTAGTVLALVLLWFVGPDFAPWHWVLALSASLVGIPVCAYCSKALGGEDHKAIVWDEFAGAWLSIMLLPFNLVWWIVAFLLFRLFDIAKPWPVGWADKHLHGGLGIMLDDILAGLMTAAILFIVQLLFF